MRQLFPARVLLFTTGIVASLAAAGASAAEPVDEVYTFAKAVANADSTTASSPVDPLYSEDVARAIDPAGAASAGASARSGGPFKVFASLSGTPTTGTEFNPGLEAESSAAQLTDYRVHSTTLPFGTPVEGRLALHFSGTLERKQQPGASLPINQLVASVDTFVELVGIGYYEGGAALADGDRIYDYGDWEGKVSFTDHGGGHSSAVIDIDDTYVFQTTVGAEFQFAYNLIALAHAVSGTDVSADVDFFDTGTFSFSGPEGVTFAVVPEPAAASLLLVGGVVGLRRRRR